MPRPAHVWSPAASKVDVDDSGRMKNPFPDIKSKLSGETMKPLDEFGVDIDSLRCVVGHIVGLLMALSNSHVVLAFGQMEPLSYDTVHRRWKTWEPPWIYHRISLQHNYKNSS